jgi:hypothetical protein
MSSDTPPSILRIHTRDWMFSNPVLFWTLMKLTDVFATDPTLPNYSMR